MRLAVAMSKTHPADKKSKKKVYRCVVVQSQSIKNSIGSSDFNAWAWPTVIIDKLTGNGTLKKVIGYVVIIASRSRSCGDWCIDVDGCTWSLHIILKHLLDDLLTYNSTKCPLMIKIEHFSFYSLMFTLASLAHFFSFFCVCDFDSLAKQKSSKSYTKLHRSHGGEKKFKLTMGTVGERVFASLSAACFSPLMHFLWLQSGCIL